MGFYWDCRAIARNDVGNGDFSLLSLRGNEMTVAISMFVEDLVRFLDCARNDVGGECAMT
jgi:hypothetical protein